VLEAVWPAIGVNSRAATSAPMSCCLFAAKVVRLQLCETGFRQSAEALRMLPSSGYGFGASSTGDAGCALRLIVMRVSDHTKG